MSISFTSFANGAAMGASGMNTEIDKIWAWLNGGVAVADLDAAVIQTRHFWRPRHFIGPLKGTISPFAEVYDRGRYLDTWNWHLKQERVDIWPELVDSPSGEYIPIPNMGCTVDVDDTVDVTIHTRFSAWEKHPLSSGGGAQYAQYMSGSTGTNGSGKVGAFRIGIRRRSDGVVFWQTEGDRPMHSATGIVLCTANKAWHHSATSERHSMGYIQWDGATNGAFDVFLAWSKYGINQHSSSAGLDEAIQQLCVGNRRMLVEVHRHQ